MPHFIIDCSEQIVKSKSPKEIIECVYEAANATRLFVPKEIKVRINTFKYYTTGNSDDDFIHVFGNIMQGRNTDQKANLSRQIVSKLKNLFPDVPVISINIRDFEKATYCNREMV
ncbi:5-carboxymethyl-2-hydroxymuconate Delta-isomerase [Winogradskyella poriferorum]|uniref:5-carboxymethyl-2-hydroxymuconate Delta-isomerase n=1 Tax=Winogradskyella poriferorum TaxID=307627 RepID=UPI003D64D07E